MQQVAPHSWKNWLAGFLVMLTACLMLLATVAQAVAQPVPDPQPETVPFFYDPDSVFDEGQQATLARDAQLLQSSSIPTLVYIRTATPEEAAPESATAFAAAVRDTWGIESADGASDGLVVVYSHVPENGGESTIVASWGEATFAESGLDAVYVESVLAGNPRTLLDDGHPFEAVVYAMRELRYGGIYFPPPPASIEGARSVAHVAANILGPTLAISVLAGIVIEWRSGAGGRFLSKPSNRGVGPAVVAVLFLLAALSVYGHSRTGVASVAMTVLLSSIHLRARSRPARLHDPDIHRRSVIPTTRRLRKRVQLRRMRQAAEARA